MNHLKFRVWDKRYKKFATVANLLLICNGDSYKETYYKPSKDTLEDFEFQLFTGIQDEESKDIYEGDICKYLININGSKSVNCKVYWKNETCAFHVLIMTFDWPLNNLIRKRLRVIGNIFENPEMKI